MRGTIFSYDHERKTGLIVGEDDNYYSLSADDCKLQIQPHAGKEVDFTPIGDKAEDIYIVSHEAAQETKDLYSHVSKGEWTHHQPKEKSAIFPIVMTIGAIGFIAIVIYSELDRIKAKEIQDTYHQQIEKIKSDLSHGQCADAAAEYKSSKETRDEIFERGLYYSLDSHAKQAHAIEIAECFANNNEFFDAIKMLDIHAVQDPDYLLRASAVYEKAGEKKLADEAKKMADKFDLSNTPK